MKYIIVGDSSADSNEEINKKCNLYKAPCKIILGDKTYIDDDNLNVADLVLSFNDCPSSPKTLPPSPEDFLKFVSSDLDCAFFITATSKLSRTYNNALEAKKLAMDKFPNIKIHVIDSKSASVGETTIALKIADLIEVGMNFDEVVSYMDKFVYESELYFLLLNLDTLIKNNHMSKLEGVLAHLLQIKAILKTTKTGEIDVHSKERSTDKAIEALANAVISTTIDTTKRVLMIAHCFNEEGAKKVKELITSKVTFKEVIIVSMRGLSSTYANVRGIICSI